MKHVAVMGSHMLKAIRRIKRPAPHVIISVLATLHMTINDPRYVSGGLYRFYWACEG